MIILVLMQVATLPSAGVTSDAFYDAKVKLERHLHHHTCA
jgi:hypothetical protein